MLCSFCNVVACTPFVDTAVKEKKFGSLKLADSGNGGNLIPLQVLVSAKCNKNGETILVKTGDYVYVKADSIQHPWAKGIMYCERVVCDGNKQPFILVPFDSIVFIDSSDTSCG